jgi:hypothetical protein
MVQYATTVNASLELTWENLLDKIENPQNFVPGVSDVIISEKNTYFVLRQMTVTNDKGSTILKEKITFEPYKVRFLLLDHAKLEGYVDNDLKAISDKETEMTFTIHWIDKVTKLEINDFELVKNAVLKTKNYIENS